MLLRMPILRNSATTAPLTTFATISTDITMAMIPNATRNGTNGAMAPASCALAARYDWVPATAPAGSALASAATSERRATAVPALRNRYSICAAAGAPGVRSAATWAGTTQAPAVAVIEVAYQTTVSLGFPGAVVTVSLLPSAGDIACAPVCPLLDSTIWPGLRAQWPWVRVRSSTGPPGDARPATVPVTLRTGGRPPGADLGAAGPPPCEPAGADRAAWSVAVTIGNGPAAAVTSASRLAEARPAGVALAE